MMPLPAAVVYALRHTRGSGQRSEHSEGDRVSEEPRGLSASGDIIGALSDRVSELTKRVGSLESELDSAPKPVSVNKEFDATERDALSGARRAAHEIRARAENAAQQILEQARDERKMLIKEIERLREERDSLVDEIASNRRSGFSALRGPRREAAVPQEKVSEETTPDSRALAADALRGVFTELLEDIRRQAGTVADAAREANAAAAQAKTAQEQPRKRAEPQTKPASRTRCVSSSNGVRMRNGEPRDGARRRSGARPSGGKKRSVATSSAARKRRAVPRERGSPPTRCDGQLRLRHCASSKRRESPKRLRVPRRRRRGRRRPLEPPSHRPSSRKRSFSQDRPTSLPRPPRQPPN